MVANLASVVDALEGLTAFVAILLGARLQEGFAEEHRRAEPSGKPVVSFYLVILFR